MPPTTAWFLFVVQHGVYVQPSSRDHPLSGAPRSRIFRKLKTIGSLRLSLALRLVVGEVVSNSPVLLGRVHLREPFELKDDCRLEPSGVFLRGSGDDSSYNHRPIPRKVCYGDTTNVERYCPVCIGDMRPGACGRGVFSITGKEYRESRTCKIRSRCTVINSSTHGNFSHSFGAHVILAELMYCWEETGQPL